IHADGEIVLVGPLLPRESKDSGVAGSEQWPVGQRVESREKPRDRRLARHRSRGELPVARCRRRYGIDRGHAQRLAESFIVPKNDRAILLDWRSCRAPKLIALERRNSAVKEISRIQSAVAKKLIDVTVESVCPRAGDRVDYPSRGSSVVGRIIAPQHRYLLDSIDSQIVAEHTARCAV